MNSLNSTDKTHEADGFVIVHYPADGSERYGIGPFPPSDEIWDMLVKDSHCDCRLERMWVSFPKGIQMVVIPSPEALAIATALLAPSEDDLPN